jgi:site-specific DNA recombinase
MRLRALLARTATSVPTVSLCTCASHPEQLEGYSLDAQVRAARGFCAERGWEIVAEYDEEGRSARYEDLNRRPRFKAMLAAADAHAFDVVLVHKLDRFARNLAVTLRTLERLRRSGAAFVSIGEQMDFTTPIGKVILATLGAFAEYYSDNLSLETKKGKRERKAQGLYNGLLPFGTTAGLDGVPGPDRRPFCVLTWTERDGRRIVDGGRETCNFEGLRFVVRLAEQGLSDRAIAQALTAAGYRTTGNRGPNPFQKDTVAEILTNRFYWGDLPVYEEAATAGNARPVQVGWTPGKHAPLEGFDEPLWERIQAMREQRRRRVGTTSRARTYALTGLLTCHVCGGRIGTTVGSAGKPRLECRTRKQGGECANRLTFTSVYEEQVGAYLVAFRIPANYQEQILIALRTIAGPVVDAEQERRGLEARLERIKKLFEWGDKPETDYLRERAKVAEKLRALAAPAAQADELEALAAVLRDVAAAWAASEPEERNQLARTLFDDLRVLGHEIVAVKPREAFTPFFRLNYETWKAENPPANQQGGSQSRQERKRRDSNPRSQP